MTHSVVIITRNRPEEVRGLLDCLADQDARADEILVVDASDTDATGRLCTDAKADLLPAIRYMHTDADICEQRNRGIDAGSGDIITFLDDDARIGPAYCSTLLEYFVRDATIAGVGGLMTGAPIHGFGEHLFRKIFLMQTNRGRNRFRASGFPDFGFAFSETTVVDFLATTAASFRKSAIGDLRFDTRTFSGRMIGLNTGRAFSEDVWFSCQVGARGTLLIAPSLSFQHRSSPTARENTHVTQALYYHAMRTVSVRAARGILGRIARRWALLGCGILSMLQTIVKHDRGYLTGYLASSRLTGTSRTA